MTKQLIALALVTAFGFAHAAETKPATDAKPAAVKVAAGDTAKTDTSKGVGSDAAVGNTPETTTPAATKAEKKPAHKRTHKKVHKKAKAAKTESEAPATADQTAK